MMLPPMERHTGNATICNIASCPVILPVAMSTGPWRKSRKLRVVARPGVMLREYQPPPARRPSSMTLTNPTMRIETAASRSPANPIQVAMYVRRYANSNILRRRAAQDVRAHAPSKAQPEIEFSYSLKSNLLKASEQQYKRDVLLDHEQRTQMSHLKIASAALCLLPSSLHRCWLRRKFLVQEIVTGSSRSRVRRTIEASATSAHQRLRRATNLIAVVWPA